MSQINDPTTSPCAATDAGYYSEMAPNIEFHDDFPIEPEAVEENGFRRDDRNNDFDNDSISDFSDVLSTDSNHSSDYFGSDTDTDSDTDTSDLNLIVNNDPGKYFSAQQNACMAILALASRHCLTIETAKYIIQLLKVIFPEDETIVNLDDGTVQEVCGKCKVYVYDICEKCLRIFPRDSEEQVQCSTVGCNG